MSWWEYGILIAGALFTGAILGPPLGLLIYDWWQNR